MVRRIEAKRPLPVDAGRLFRTFYAMEMLNAAPDRLSAGAGPDLDQGPGSARLVADETTLLVAGDIAGVGFQRRLGENRFEYLAVARRRVQR